MLFNRTGSSGDAPMEYMGSELITYDNSNTDYLVKKTYEGPGELQVLRWDMSRGGDYSFWIMDKKQTKYFAIVELSQSASGTGRIPFMEDISFEGLDCIVSYYKGNPENFGSYEFVKGETIDGTKSFTGAGKLVSSGNNNGGKTTVKKLNGITLGGGYRDGVNFGGMFDDGAGTVYFEDGITINGNNLYYLYYKRV